MAAYLQMYLRGGEGVVSEDAVRQMLNDGVEVEDEIRYRYAFGWNRIDAPLPVPVYRHAGLTETSMTCMYLIPSIDLGIVLLTNANDYLVGTDLLDRLGWNLVLEILGEERGKSKRENTDERTQYGTSCTLVFSARERCLSCCSGALFTGRRNGWPQGRLRVLCCISLSTRQRCFFWFRFSQTRRYGLSAASYRTCTVFFL